MKLLQQHVRGLAGLAAQEIFQGLSEWN